MKASIIARCLTQLEKDIRGGYPNLAELDYQRLLRAARLQLEELYEPSLRKIEAAFAERRDNVFQPPDRDWDEHAACRNALNQDAWFPSREDAARMGPDLKYALAHCASCPVRRECLQAGMESHSDGIWGGVFAWEFEGQRPTKENVDRLLFRANQRIAAWGLGRVFEKATA